VKRESRQKLNCWPVVVDSVERVEDSSSLPNGSKRLTTQEGIRIRMKAKSLDLQNHTIPATRAPSCHGKIHISTAKKSPAALSALPIPAPPDLTSIERAARIFLQSKTLKRRVKASESRHQKTSILINQT